MRAKGRRYSQKLFPISPILMTGLVVAAVLQVVAAMAQPLPLVGDIVVFSPGAATSGNRLLVHRAGHFGCVLDFAVMRRAKGSLVVESVQRGGFRLHWAGARTSGDAADCGSDAELILSRGDMLALSQASDHPLGIVYNELQ